MRKIIFILLVLFVGYATKSYAAAPVTYTCPSGYALYSNDICYATPDANDNCPAGGYWSGNGPKGCDVAATPSSPTTAPNPNSGITGTESVPIAQTDIPDDGTLALGALGKGYTASALADIPNYTQGIHTAAMDLGALTFTILLFWLGVQTVLGEKINWMKESMWVMASLLFFAGSDKIGMLIVGTVNELQNQVISADNMAGAYHQISFLLGMNKMSSIFVHHTTLFGKIFGAIGALINDAVILVKSISVGNLISVILDGLCQLLTMAFFGIRTIILCMMVAVAPIVAALSLIPPYRKLLGSWFKDFVEVTFWKFIISMMFYVVFQIIQSNSGTWSFGIMTIALMMMLVILIYSTPKIASMSMHQGMSGLNEVIGLGAGLAMGNSSMRFFGNNTNAAGSSGSSGSSGSGGSNGKTSISTNPSNFSTGAASVPSILSNSGLSNTSKLEQIAAANSSQVGNIARAAINGNDATKANALDKISNIHGLVDPDKSFSNIKGDVNIGNMSNVKDKLENLSVNPNLNPDTKAKVDSSLQVVNSNMSDNSKLSALNHITGLSTNDSYKNELQNSLKSSEPLNEIKNNLPFASQNANIANTVGAVSGIVNSNMSDNNKISALNHVTGLSTPQSFSNDIQNILHNNDPIQAINEVKSSLTYASQNPNLTNSAGTVDSIIHSSISAPEKVNALNLVTTNETNYKSSLSNILQNSNYDQVINKITSDSSYISQNPNLNNINTQINNVIKNSSTNEVKVNELRKLI